MSVVTGELEFDAQTDKGMVRSENQDRTGVWVDDDATPGGERGSLFVVCDGMGGHNGGSIASATAVEALLAGFRESPRKGMKQRLGHAIELANSAVRKKAAQDIALRNMGTTCVALVLRGRRAQVAHIGDSRAYLFRGGTSEQITRDHTYLNDLIEIGLLTPERAKNHPERNIITRCIGMGDSLQIDFNARDLQAGDIFLLCTDGLYNYVEGEEMQKVALAQSPAEACETLVRLANTRGGEDNITCLVVKVKSLPSGDAAELSDDTGPVVRKPTPGGRAPDAIGLDGPRGGLAGTDITEIVPAGVQTDRRVWWRGWILVIVAELVILTILIAIKVLL
jgi:protein phosphatase